MKQLLVIVLIGMLVSSAAAQEQSSWWQGSFVKQGSGSCDANDTLIQFERENVIPWEVYCKVKLRTEVRDMQGVLLDIDCSYPDSPDEGYADRLALFELSDGTVLSYSRLSKQAQTLRRCPQ